ncbi:cupin domain-containing protein [Ruegeria arenilitoris]|uniref:cupin domain-containing protein n=1 Tax=Ruegeria arenilitoris TaxID=1173585 RepID=UPI00147F2589|nr:cupin domain-containing protein [Ruegeria arenilitoris]
MKPIQATERLVANIYDKTAYIPYDPDGSSETGTHFIQLNPDAVRDVGFYIYRMEPGSSSTPHRHGGAEEFLIIQGELIDNDGTVYKQGDVVWLAKGTEHSSYTETGCLIAVYAESTEHPLSAFE